MSFVDTLPYSVDDYIKDQDTLSSNFFNDKEFWVNRGSLWLGSNEEPRTHLQKLIHMFWKPVIEEHKISFAGFEYWSSVLEGDSNTMRNESLDLHRDMDEKYFEDTDDKRFPMFGSVFYPIVDSVQGGELIIYDDNAEPLHTFEPKRNRIVFFESGRFWHRVTPVTDGTRVHFAINIWDEIPYGLDKEDGIGRE